MRWKICFRGSIRRLEITPKSVPVCPDSAGGWDTSVPSTLGSLGSSQGCTTGALCALSVVEVAHLDFSRRGHFDAGAAAGIYAIPTGLTDQCADKVLFEFARGPGTDRQSFVLGLNNELQVFFNELGRLHFLGLFAREAKRVPLRGYLDLDTVELSNPFADQVGFGMRRDTGGKGQERAKRDEIVDSHDGLFLPIDVTTNSGGERP